MRNPSVTTRTTWNTFRIRNLNLNLARPYGRMPGTWNVAGLVWSGNSNFETLMDVGALETWDGKAARAWAPTANGRGIWIDLGMDMFPLTKRMQEDLPLMRWCGARKPRQQKAYKDFGAGLPQCRWYFQGFMDQHGVMHPLWTQLELYRKGANTMHKHANKKSIPLEWGLDKDDAGHDLGAKVRWTWLSKQSEYHPEFLVRHGQILWLPRTWICRALQRSINWDGSGTMQCPISACPYSHAGYWSTFEQMAFRTLALRTRSHNMGLSTISQSMSIFCPMGSSWLAYFPTFSWFLWYM